MAAAGAVRGGTGGGGAAAAQQRGAHACPRRVSCVFPSPAPAPQSGCHHEGNSAGGRADSGAGGLGQVWGGGGCGASSIFRPGTGRSMRARARGTSAEPPHSETSPPMIPLLRESQSRKYRMDSRHQSHAELSGAEMLGQTRTPAPTTHPPPTTSTARRPPNVTRVTVHLPKSCLYHLAFLLTGSS